MTISLLAGAYLFFGGAGAGTLFFAALLGLWGLRSARETRVYTRALAVGLGLLAAGILCLIFDLGRPSQALLLFVNPTWSFLTVGTYLLSALAVLGLALLLIGAMAPAKARDGDATQVARALMVLLALGVMAYTGLLLRDLRPIHLWTSAWLPVLFVLSSLAAGAACVMLCSSLADETLAVRRVAARRYMKLDVVLVAAEALVCAFYLLAVRTTALGAASVSALVSGEFALLFWCGFVLCGIAVPLGADVALLVRRQDVNAGVCIAAGAGSIIGCLCLRMGLVLAGAHVVL